MAMGALLLPKALLSSNIGEVLTMFFGVVLGQRMGLHYIVVYTVCGDAVYVVRILHGAQQWP